MKKATLLPGRSFLFCLIILFSQCSKETVNKPQTPGTPIPEPDKKVLRLSKMTGIAASGANIEFELVYTDSLPTQINFIDIGIDTIIYKFRYTNGTLDGIDQYLSNNKTAVPSSRLNVFYSDGNMVKAERYFKFSDTLALSEYADYSFDNNHHLLEKIIYNNVQGAFQLSSKNNYTYNQYDDISEVLTTLPDNRIIKYDNTYTSTENLFYKKTPQMAPFSWYMFDPNAFVGGAMEAQILSKHNPSGTDLQAQNVNKHFDLRIYTVTDSLWSEIISYPILNGGNNDVIFQRLSFEYALMP